MALDARRRGGLPPHRGLLRGRVRPRHQEPALGPLPLSRAPRRQDRRRSHRLLEGVHGHVQAPVRPLRRRGRAAHAARPQGRAHRGRKSDRHLRKVLNYSLLKNIIRYRLAKKEGIICP